MIGRGLEPIVRALCCAPRAQWSFSEVKESPAGLLFCVLKVLRQCQRPTDHL